MSKLLAALVASLFAVSTAFAASHAGAPMAGASGAKMEKKEAKAEAKAEKKAAKAEKKSKKKAEKAEKKS
jgi:nucleoid-associated protein YgaU